MLRTPLLRAALLPALIPLTMSCDDGVTPPDGADEREYAVVVNSVSSSLTIFPTEAPDSTYTIGLNPEGTPVLVATRSRIALVPLGAFPGVAVVDLLERVVERTVPLPIGSTPTGVAIVDDSLAFVTLGTGDAVVPVLYDRGVALDAIPTGTWPEAALHHEGRVFVLNSRFLLDTFSYEGPGTVTVIDVESLDVIDTIELTGTNPGGIALLDGSLWVLNRGNYNDIDGSLSEIDPTTLEEIDHIDGFGFGPGGVTRWQDQLAVASFGYGVALWSPQEGFVRTPAEGFRPEEETAVADVGANAQGRLFIVDGQCAGPGGVYLVNDALEVVDHTDTEVCPFDIVFTEF